MSTVSSAQTIALTGLLNGQGIKPSPSMFQKFATFDQLPVVTIINNMFAGTSNTVSNVSGLYNSINTMPKWISGRHANVKISNVAGTSANLILGNGVSGIKNFATFLSQASSFCSTVLPWHGAINKYEGKEFADLGLQNKSYSDITSGGITGRFQGLKSYPGGIQTGLNDLADAIVSFGTLYDFTNLLTAFTPSGFILNLQNQGIAGLSESRLNDTDEAIVLKAMSQVSGEIINTIKNQTGVVLPSQSNITTLADFFDSRKMFSGALSRYLTPSGSMQELANSLGKIGGTYRNGNELSEVLRKTTATNNLTNLEATETPLPQSDITAISSKIGRDSSGKLGTGPIGNPIMKDILGSVGGVNITKNYDTMIIAQQKINLTSLKNELQSIYSQDKTPGGYSGTLTTLNNIISTLNNSTDVAATSANVSVNLVLDQLTREETLRPLAGIDLLSPLVINGSTMVINMAKQLPNFGKDSQQLGYEEIFTNIADSSNRYGDAVLASLSEGKTKSVQQSAGIPDNISANAQDQLQAVSS